MVSVEGISLSAESDSLVAHSVDSQNAEFSPEELYKHALQYYKGTQSGDFISSS